MNCSLLVNGSCCQKEFSENFIACCSCSSFSNTDTVAWRCGCFCGVWKQEKSNAFWVILSLHCKQVPLYTIVKNYQVCRGGREQHALFFSKNQCLMLYSTQRHGKWCLPCFIPKAFGHSKFITGYNLNSHSCKQLVHQCQCALIIGSLIQLQWTNNCSLQLKFLYGKILICFKALIIYVPQWRRGSNPSSFYSLPYMGCWYSRHTKTISFCIQQKGTTWSHNGTMMARGIGQLFQ